MQKSCSLLKAALATASFKDADVESETIALINTLEAELDSTGFEAGSDLEEAEFALEEALNEADEEREDLDALAEEALSAAGEDSDDDDGSQEV